MVVRRLCFPRRPDGGVEREAPIEIFRQTIDRGVLAWRDGEVLEGKQLGLGGEADHHALDLVESRAADAMPGFQVPDIGDRRRHRRRAPIHQRCRHGFPLTW